MSNKKIVQIHKHGDYQTDDYRIGNLGVISIERFNINGEQAYYPRLRVIFENGKTVELDEAGTTVYEVAQP